MLQSRGAPWWEHVPMQVTHFGHSCVLLDTGAARLLLDPGGFSSGFEDLTGLDAVLVTHQHPDHLDTERLPVLLAGRGGGTIDTGRHVRLDQEVPMCNLFLSMLDRVGVTVDYLGDSTGRLSGLQM